MGEKETQVAVAVGSEVVKLLLQLAIQQAQRANMTAFQIEELYTGELNKFNGYDPGAIPDPE